MDLRPVAGGGSCLVLLSVRGVRLWFCEKCCSCLPAARNLMLLATTLNPEFRKNRLSTRIVFLHVLNVAPTFQQRPEKMTRDSDGMKLSVCVDGVSDC